jgi:NitT/TauT family transport system ATP-binding protein
MPEDLMEAADLAASVHVMSNRPGRFVFRSEIEVPRPCATEMRSRSDFIEYVHQLCTHSGRACEAT